MRAIYDLTRMPTTYDFAAWAVIAKTRGVDSVRFIIDGPIAQWKYGPDIAWKRFATILLPICRLARIEYEVGTRVRGPEFPYHGGDVCRLYSELGRLEKLKPTLRTDGSGYVTITMRDSFRNKHRNSNKEAWAKFQEYLAKRQIRYTVLQECEDAPMNLEHRMAYYANAAMNLGVAQGPMALCIFSEAPYITLNQNPPDTTGEAQYDIDKLLVKTGFPPGSQYNFRHDRQWLVWEPDTYENIVRAYEQMEAGEFKVKKEAA